MAPSMVQTQIRKKKKLYSNGHELAKVYENLLHLPCTANTLKWKYKTLKKKIIQWPYKKGYTLYNRVEKFETFSKKVKTKKKKTTIRTKIFKFSQRNGESENQHTRTIKSFTGPEAHYVHLAHISNKYHI